MPRLASSSIAERFETMQDTHKPTHVFIPARDLGHDNWFVALTRGLLYLGCAHVFVDNIFYCFRLIILMTLTHKHSRAAVSQFKEY